MQPVSDYELMARVRERDAAAFEVLFRRYRPRVTRHLLRVVRGHWESLDRISREWQDFEAGGGVGRGFHVLRYARPAARPRLRRSRRHRRGRSAHRSRHPALRWPPAELSNHRLASGVLSVVN